MSTLLRYEPPSGALADPIETRTRVRKGIQLVNLEGTRSRSSRVSGEQYLGAPGTRLGAAQTGERVVSASARIWARHTEAVHELLDEIARSLYLPVTQVGEDVDPGWLSVQRYGGELRRIRAVPRDGGIVDLGPEARGVHRIDLEWLLVDAYWQGPEFTLEVETGDRMTFPLEMPFITANFGTSQVATLSTSIPSPISVRFEGPASEPELVLTNTEQRISYSGTLEDGEAVVVDTTPGRKSATFISADGTETNALPDIVRAGSELWQLLPGTNALRYLSPAATGKAVVTSAPRYVAA